MSVRPFECDLKGWDGMESAASTIFAATRSKARYRKWLNFKDAGWDVRFQDITVRACGPSPEFLEAAQ